MSRTGGIQSYLAGTVAAAAWLMACAAPAHADFKICNKTGSNVGIAIGYKDDGGWKTEGWWNVVPNSCDSIMTGTLVARYYYVYAVDYDSGGEWSGKAFMCTQDKIFTIQGYDDCVKRGFDLTGFFEIDTGKSENWTVQLTEPAQQGTGGQ